MPFLPRPCRYPLRHGVVDNWDLMEKFMEQAIFKCARRAEGARVVGC